MVKIYTVILCLCFGSLAYGQIYVNATATGANNGTTWANAFTKVESALAATGTNIWIARGTYKPEGAANDTTVSFRMTNPKNIYGGFAGTETTLTTRNIALNPTILNGDMLGNDNVDSLYFNKLDNRRHVLFIDSLVRSTVILDGLTVSGGATRTTTSGTNRSETSGGGVLSYTSMIIRNCRFLNNFARLGGGICVFGDSLFTVDILVENTIFEKNLCLTAANSGAGLYVIQVDSAVINNCTSIKNYAVQGSIGIWTGNYVGVNNCTFTENRNNTASTIGAGLFIIAMRHQNIQNSTFTKNTSNISGNSLGMYISNAAYQTSPDNSTTVIKCIFRDNETATAGSAAFRIFQGNKISLIDCEIAANKGTSAACATISSSASIFGKADNLLIQNCKFFNNVITSSTTNRGGALTIDSNTGIIKDCAFENNSNVRGPHIAIEGTARPNEFTGPNSLLIENCNFNGGLSPTFGGAIYCAMGNGQITFKQCNFTGNKSSATCGGIFVGFKSKVNILDCDFILNEAGTSGGVFFVQNDTTVLTVKDSRFTSNSAIAASGGVLSSSDGSVPLYNFTNNKFVGNTASNNAGALNFLCQPNATLPNDAILLDRNLFEENVSMGGLGGAVVFSRRGALVQNNIFARNVAEGAGQGGAIAYSNSDSLLRKELRLINNTFIGNKGEFVSGVATFQDTAVNRKANGLVTLQNNLFLETIGTKWRDNGKNTGPDVLSNGGNIYINSESMRFMSANLDQVSPSFSLNDADYSLKPGSAAINYGIASGAPTYDFKNLLRIGRPDAGAIEFGATVNGIKASDIKSLMIYPNPSADYIKVDELAVSNARYLIFSLDGKLVDRGSIPSNGQIDIKKLTVGNYYLQVNDGKVNIGSFVKQ